MSRCCVLAMIDNGCLLCNKAFKISDHFCKTGILSINDYKYIINDNHTIFCLEFVIKCFGGSFNYPDRNYKKEYKMMEKTFSRYQYFGQIIGSEFMIYNLHKFLNNRQVLDLFIKYLDNLYFCNTLPTTNIEKHYDILDFLNESQLNYITQSKKIYNKMGNSEKYQIIKYKIFIKYLYLQYLLIPDIAINIYKMVRKTSVSKNHGRSI